MIFKHYLTTLLWVCMLSSTANCIDEHIPYRGWYYFEEKQKTTIADERAALSVEQQEQMAVAELEAFSQRLEAAKANMVMHPSVENAQRYIKLQNAVFKKADKVSHYWKKAMIDNPNIDITRDIPMSAEGVRIRRNADEQQQSQILKTFAKEWKLLFFHASYCKYCIGFAPVLKAFATKYGFVVSTIQLDAAGISQSDIELAHKVNIGKYGTPSVFIYNESLGIITPVSSGYLSIDQLEQNAIFITKEIKKQLRNQQ